MEKIKAIKTKSATAKKSNPKAAIAKGNSALENYRRLLIKIQYIGESGFELNELDKSCLRELVDDKIKSLTNTVGRQKGHISQDDFQLYDEILGQSEERAIIYPRKNQIIEEDLAKEYGVTTRRIRQIKKGFRDHLIIERGKEHYQSEMPIQILIENGYTPEEAMRHINGIHTASLNEGEKAHLRIIEKYMNNELDISMMREQMPEEIFNMSINYLEKQADERKRKQYSE